MIGTHLCVRAPPLIKEQPETHLSPATPGETSVEAWVGGIRDAPAPWAEMEFENIIITLPSTAVRDLDRPDEVAELWDSIMRAVADLAAKPAMFTRKERIVGDVQISAGKSPR